MEKFNFCAVRTFVFSAMFLVHQLRIVFSFLSARENWLFPQYDRAVDDE